MNTTISRALRVGTSAWLLATLAGAPAGAAGQQLGILQNSVTIEMPDPLGMMGPTTPMPSGTAVIVGRVVDGGANRPVPGVVVTLTVPGARPLRVLADSLGQFAFRDLPGASVQITAEKSGYVVGGFGRLRPGGQTQPLQLKAGERLGDVVISIWKFGAVSGVVRDQSGEPVVGMTVQALRRRMTAGRPQLSGASVAVTDDRGAYRLAALEPGDYVVATTGGNGIGSGLIPPLPMLGPPGAGNTFVVSAPLGAPGTRSARVGQGDPASSLDASRSLAGIDSTGRLLTYVVQFFPSGTTTAEAMPIRIESGQDRAGIDFSLVPSATRRVSGTLIGPDGPASSFLVTMSPAQSGDIASPLDQITVPADPSGNFSFPSVAPGSYIVRASQTLQMNMPVMNGERTQVRTMQAMPAAGLALPGFSAGVSPMIQPAGLALWAETIVTIDASDVDNLSLVLNAGGRVTGTVEFVGGADRPDLTRLGPLPVWLEPAEGPAGGPAMPVQGQIAANGTFSTSGVTPGRYLVRSGPIPPNWKFRGATLGGEDVSDLPLAIGGEDVSGIVLTFSDHVTTINGQVSGPGGPATDVSVLAFPTDASQWTGYGMTPRTIVSVRADRQGQYSVRDLPAGAYYVVAVPEANAGDWQDPEFLESVVGRAVTIRVADGQQLNVPLRVTP